MPTVAFIEELKIELYFKDHPPPHIHAKSAEHEVLIVIDDASIFKGSLPIRKLKKVTEYVADPKNKKRLMTLWQEYSGN
ncbi:hypothetical protein GCM10027299_45800 [Larkinella ripae]